MLYVCCCGTFVVYAAGSNLRDDVSWEKMLMGIKRLFTSLLLGSTLLTLASCGSNGQVQIVKGLKVETTVVDNQLKLRVTSEIDFGNIMFPTLQIPIMKDGAAVGSVSMIPILGSKTQFVVDMNVAEIGDLGLGQVTLPNGTLAPLIGTNPAISVDLGNNAKLYVAAAQNAYAIGVAIPISGLDSLGQSLGGLNFFPMFAFEKAVGAAGIFASNTPGKSGFAFFVDVTQYLQGLDLGLPLNKKNEVLAMSREMMQAESHEIALDYNEQRPTAAKEKRLKEILFKWNQQKRRLAR